MLFLCIIIIVIVFRFYPGLKTAKAVCEHSFRFSTLEKQKEDKKAKYERKEKELTGGSEGGSLCPHLRLRPYTHKANRLRRTPRTALPFCRMA